MMKNLIAFLSIFVFISSISCSDMVKKVMEPEGETEVDIMSSAAVSVGESIKLPSSLSGVDVDAKVVDVIGADGLAGSDGVADGLDFNGDGAPEAIYLMNLPISRIFKAVVTSIALDIDGDGDVDFYLDIGPGGVFTLRNAVDDEPVIIVVNETTGGDIVPVGFDIGGDGGGTPDIVVIYGVPAGDTTAPIITDFSLIVSSTTVTSPVIGFTLDGTDDNGVIFWLINETSTAPEATDDAWTLVQPTEYTLSGGAGSYDVYAWAKDIAGNISDQYTPISVFYDSTDNEAPVVESFTIGETPCSGSCTTTSATIVATITESDNIGVTGWLITEDATEPLANDAGWETARPTDYTLSGSFETYTLYAWVKDAANNVSTEFTSIQVIYDMPIGIWDDAVLSLWDQCVWGP